MRDPGEHGTDPANPSLRKFPTLIVSGGQTGVDRAALDVAQELGISCGGWCPNQRRAEDGPIPARYPLRETGSKAHHVRTRWNVRDSDATLILACGPLTGGTELTRQFAEQFARPALVIDLQDSPSVDVARHWLRQEKIGILNIAGPRESTSPGCYQLAKNYLRELLGENRQFESI